MLSLDLFNLQAQKSTPLIVSKVKQDVVNRCRELLAVMGLMYYYCYYVDRGRKNYIEKKNYTKLAVSHFKSKWSKLRETKKEKERGMPPPRKDIQDKTRNERTAKTLTG